MKQYVKWAGLLLPAFSVLIIIILLFLPLFPPSLLVVSQGKVLGEYPVQADNFEVQFRHSVNKGLIREVYKIDAERLTITLDKGYFESYGAGMIDTVPPEVTYSSDEQFVILDFADHYRHQIDYTAGIVSQHMFYYEDKSLVLYKLAPRKPVAITVRKASAVQRLLGLCQQLINQRKG
ncbi:uncharacterized protein DUF1850 [Hydrogenoanaerobacterium saccharovorans]|uniref:DUF1850 domain-containing protein n=1 Tax=Hydrogenoanaerobacterium saccharovorans TaxID=474960 RepID=A0A1H8CM85_9FIRM|nr:DUF1850 domain-containing protein [Hydrogenoanaerobacterium saccharovorans]RPF43207.1 uncharacterized protein DUF1850 [Hydrogenoanaerobacterium saccharovorans]SEM96145.1 protein of unknown function [Hydrogenoanaerobacterium saccharovorans]